MSKITHLFSFVYLYLTYLPLPYAFIYDKLVLISPVNLNIQNTTYHSLIYKENQLGTMYGRIVLTN